VDDDDDVDDVDGGGAVEGEEEEEEEELWRGEEGGWSVAGSATQRALIDCACSIDAEIRPN
jgi:hypothetical protein